MFHATQDRTPYGARGSNVSNNPLCPTFNLHRKIVMRKTLLGHPSLNAAAARLTLQMQPTQHTYTHTITDTHLQVVPYTCTTRPFRISRIVRSRLRRPSTGLAPILSRSWMHATTLSWFVADSEAVEFLPCQTGNCHACKDQLADGFTLQLK